jgi:hypothetical protein
MLEYNIINVISLEHRTDRMELFHQQSLEQQFGYRVWPGILYKGDNKRGVNLAHRQIVQYAKDNNLPFIIICEDDTRFFASGAFKYFIDNIPNDYDTFHGMIYVGEIVDNRIITVFSGMTLYAINNRFYDFFLSLPESIHIDRELGNYANQFKFMVCDKFVCEQIGGKSDNNYLIGDYRPYLKGRKIFGDIKID